MPYLSPQEAEGRLDFLSGAQVLFLQGTEHNEEDNGENSFNTCCWGVCFQS